MFLSEEVLRVVPRDEEVMTDSMAIKGYGRHCADAVREVELPGPEGGVVRAVCRYRRLPNLVAAQAAFKTRVHRAAE